MSKSTVSEGIVPVLAALALLATHTGCEGAFGRAVTVSDSAGVAIVRSHRPQWPEGGGWTVRATPAYTLTGPAPGQTFGRITGVALLDGGGAVVADAADLSLHFFDGTGTRVRSVQPGDTPVMPRSLARVYRIDDEVYVAQRGLGPTLVFDANGTYLRAIEPPAVERYQFISQYRPMADGSLLAIQPPTGLLPRGDEWTENAQFVRIPPDDTAERVLSIPAVRFARIPSSVEAVVFGPVLGFAFSTDGVFAGYPERFAIGDYGSDGTLRRSIRRDWEPVPVSDADAEAVRERLLSLMTEAGIPDDPELREQPESQVRELHIAESLPAFGRLLLDSDGRLWAERVPPVPVVVAGPFPTRPEPAPWDVFDTDGAWLGTVATPADTHVMDIGADAMAGILQSGGSSQVVVHRVERTTGQD
jgi:hypothetical protein